MIYSNKLKQRRLLGGQVAQGFQRRHGEPAPRLPDLGEVGRFQEAGESGQARAAPEPADVPAQPEAAVGLGGSAPGLAEEAAGAAPLGQGDVLENRDVGRCDVEPAGLRRYFNVLDCSPLARRKGARSGAALVSCCPILSWVGRNRGPRS